MGLRKVVGSDRQGLIRQFLLESIVTSGFSFLLAIGLAAVLLLFFNKLAGTSMHFPWTAWWKLAPQQTLRYNFPDESFEHMYADVRQTGNIFTSLAILAVCIACLGLFALSAFMAEQRRKEMGIRKVLGASVIEVAGIEDREG